MFEIDFKLHCSSINTVMAKATAGRTIPEGAKTVCKAWYLDQWFNRQPLHASSKYTRKGTEVEWEAIKLLNQHRKARYGKNPSTFENEFFIGTPDIIETGLIIDIKCPYSHSTFPTLENELNPLYYDQMQGYMDLTGIKQAEVVYCLVNAPKKAIESEAWNYAKTYNEGELTPEILAQFTAQMSYDDVPIEKRIKVFTVERSPERIEAIRQRVIDCRTYLKSLGA